MRGAHYKYALGEGYIANTLQMLLAKKMKEKSTYGTEDSGSEEGGANGSEEATDSETATEE